MMRTLALAAVNAADVVAAEGDPTQDVKHVVFVMKQGAVCRSTRPGEATGWPSSPPPAH